MKPPYSIVGITIAIALGSKSFIVNRGLEDSNLRRIVMSDYLDLYDFRCRVTDMYRERMRAALAGEDAETILRRFRETRDELFAHHPQSALDEEQRRNFQGLRYFPYNPAMCVIADIDTNVEHIVLAVAMNAEEAMTMTTVGRLKFTIGGEAVELSLSEVVATSLTRSRGVISCRHLVTREENVSCLTSIMPIIHHARITIDGFVPWLPLRIVSMCLFVPER